MSVLGICSLLWGVYPVLPQNIESTLTPDGHLEKVIDAWQPKPNRSYISLSLVVSTVETN
jgi:hypothetical protein